MFPRHDVSMEISHNLHKTYYQSIEEWIAEDNELSLWESEEHKARAISSNEIWTMQWYPLSPTGFHSVSAPTWDELLSWALRVEAMK